MSVIKPQDFDVSKLRFEEPRSVSGNSGSRTAMIRYGSGMLEMQTPAMRAPFGLDFNPDNPDKIELHLSFDGFDQVDKPECKNMVAMYGAMERLDEAMPRFAVANSASWFNKPLLHEDVARDRHQPIIKRGVNKTTGAAYTPRMKVVLSRYDGKWKFTAVDMSGSDMTQEIVTLATASANGGKNPTRGMQVQAIIRAGTAWMSGIGYGVTWKVVKLRVVMPTGGDAGIEFEVDPLEDALMRKASLAPAMPRPADDTVQIGGAQQLQQDRSQIEDSDDGF